VSPGGRPQGLGPPLWTRIPKRHSRGETGFTLIELLVVVAIIPLVVGAISVSLLSVFKNEQPVANSLTSSGDAQVTSSTFVQDIQSASWITSNALDLCGGVAGTLLLSVSPDDVASGSSIKNVTSYVEVANSGSSTYTIKRETCTGGTGSPSTTTRVVSHNALGSTSVSVIPTSLIINTNWVAASGATSVTLNLAEPARTGSGTTNSYTLTAVPRITGTPGTPPSGFEPILPLELVGSSCSTTTPGINITGGSSSVTIQDGKGGLGGFGISESQSQCPNPVGGSGAGTFSAQTPYNYNVPNPLASLAPPSFPSPSGLGAGSCTATTCTSGVYGSNTTGAYSNGNVSSGVTFDPSLGPNPGVVVFTVPVTVNGVTFDGGASVTSTTYWFEQGLSVADHTTATFGSATYIFGTSGGSGTVLQAGNHSTIAVPVTSPGLLFYVPPGSANVSFPNAMSGTLTGSLNPYLYLAIWDASSGTLNFGTGGGGGSASGYGNVGGVYDPNGSVAIAGGYNLTATYFVVNSFSVQTTSVLATG
jgi:prepilin-type N-terminal cleavage/methylation domain-containing protein